MESYELEQVISEAQALLDAKQYPQAIKILSSLLAQNSDHADALFLRGKAHACWLSFPEAERDFKTAISIHPEKTEYYLELGHTYLEQEQIDRAATEFLRAKHLSPDDLEVQLSFMKVQVLRGEYAEVMPELEKLQKKHPNDHAVADLLVDVYHDKALENWHVETDKEKIYYALKKSHIDDAEVYLNKITGIAPQSEYVQLVKESLFGIIKIGKTRKFNGGFFSLIIPFILIVSGFSSGGFLGFVYAISAATYFFANRRPVYVTNHLIYANKDDFSAIDRIMNFIDGDWMLFSSSISGVIVQKAKLALIMQLIKAVLTSIFIPLTVFSALRKNYSLKYAGIFVLVVGISVAISNTVINYRLERNRNYVASLHEAINTNNYKEFVELEAERPKLVLKSRSTFLLNAVKRNNPDAFDYLISHFKIALNQRQGQYYLNYATRVQAKKMIEHLSQYQVIPQKSIAENNNQAKDRISRPPDQTNTSESIVKDSTPGKIELINYSFEADKIGASGWQFGILNWAGSRHGVVIPNTTMFTDGKSPTGKQMAFLSKSGSWMEQTLLIQPKTDWNYRLRVKAGLRLESNFPPGNYELQLYAGSNLLHREKFAAPSKGEFEEKNLYFKMDKVLPENDSFRIRIVNLDAKQLSFDDIRFYANEQSTKTAKAETIQEKTKQSKLKPTTKTEPVDENIDSQPEEKQTHSQSLAPSAVKSHSIVGCWKWSNGGYIIITDNGVAQIKGFWQGKWSMGYDGANEYIITWPSVMDTIELNQEGTAYSGKNIFNLPIHGQRAGKASKELLGTWIREDGVELKVNGDGTISAAQFKGTWEKTGDGSYQMQWPVVDELTFVDANEIQVKNQFGDLSASRDKSCSMK